MSHLLRWCYLALIVWQAAWLGYLPAPFGPALGIWGALTALPLALMLRGIWLTQPNGINWASYLLIFYFMLGVGEAWSNPGQQLAALVQVSLVCICFTAVVAINLERKRAAQKH